MAKKYTLMFFNEDRLGRVRTFTISSRLIIGSILFIFVLIGALAGSVYKMNLLYGERTQAIAFNEENQILQTQLSAYTQQIETLVSKITELGDFEYQIRDLVAMQTGDLPLKPIAVGGKEVDLLREYSTAAALNEKDFFTTLDATLIELSYEVENRELHLSELASTLEEKRMLMLFTPTIWPVKGWLSSQFGYRASPFTGRQTFHEGIDIASRMNNEVMATASGVVVFAGPKSGFGHLVTIDHGYGYMTRYGHNSSLTVKVGEKVEKGQVIAKVGSSGQSTGPHVHYEVLVNGIPVNPLKFIVE